MGMYDSVWVKCANVGRKWEFQTKTVNTFLENYH